MTVDLLFTIWILGGIELGRLCVVEATFAPYADERTLTCQQRVVIRGDLLLRPPSQAGE